MITIEKLLLLKAVQIFKYTPDEVLYDIAQVMIEKDVDAGESIIKQGELGDDMFIIADGKVKVHENEKTLKILGIHDVFGELAAFSPEVRVASVTALENSFLLKIDRDTMFELMEKHSGLVQGVLEALCQRTRDILKTNK